MKINWLMRRLTVAKIRLADDTQRRELRKETAKLGFFLVFKLLYHQQIKKRKNIIQQAHQQVP